MSRTRQESQIRESAEVRGLLVSHPPVSRLPVEADRRLQTEDQEREKEDAAVLP